eukprot:TRINITY_DN13032_c0_g1_i1.p2 TRINITY_DN13032_c0_g1~~TRINITY_DN13032_c0_g1_i1.p2  ORF type:complete len:330 (-),score=87.89 TRINITY_DN13032_c0_g1_i1:99-1067(-)
MRSILLTVVACSLLGSAFADLYMQAPRGSNDRLNEASDNRQNANRLFDSQNNAKGGYCYGPAMEYYAGSILNVEWTNQHACGNDGIECTLVFQYMCQAPGQADDVTIRDGTTTNTIPTNDKDAAMSKTANGDFVYGMHESYQYYKDCAARSRNKGLFLADQNIGDRAVNTRQNNGNRHGTECAEERDYYPYFHPSPWKDIVVMTDNSKGLCPYIKANSQNVISKNYCSMPNGNGNNAIPNSEAACKQAGGAWSTTDAFNIPAPDCLEAPWSRDNHPGNGVGQSANTYNWTLPTAKTESCINEGGCTCVFRMRYNISNSNVVG